MALDMNRYLKEKASQIQVETSKKVIKQFYKQVQTDDQSCQTQNKEDSIIHRLTQKVKDIQNDYNDVRAQLFTRDQKISEYVEKFTKNEMKRRAAVKSTENTKKEIEDLKGQIQEEQKLVAEAKEDAAKCTNKLKIFQEAMFEKQKMLQDDIKELEEEIQTLRGLYKDQRAITENQKEQIEKLSQESKEKSRIFKEQHQEIIRLNEANMDLDMQVQAKTRNINNLTDQLNSSAGTLSKNSKNGGRNNVNDAQGSNQQKHGDSSNQQIQIDVNAKQENDIGQNGNQQRPKKEHVRGASLIRDGQQITAYDDEQAKNNHQFASLPSNHTPISFISPEQVRSNAQENREGKIQDVHGFQIRTGSKERSKEGQNSRTVIFRSSRVNTHENSKAELEDKNQDANDLDQNKRPPKQDQKLLEETASSHGSKTKAQNGGTKSDEDYNDYAEMKDQILSLPCNNNLESNRINGSEYSNPGLDSILQNRFGENETTSRNNRMELNNEVVDTQNQKSNKSKSQDIELEKQQDMNVTLENFQSSKQNQTQNTLSSDINQKIMRPKIYTDITNADIDLVQQSIIQDVTQFPKYQPPKESIIDIAKFDKQLSPERYKYYLEKPLENLQKSENKIEQMVHNRVGKMDIEIFNDQPMPFGGWSDQMVQFINIKRSLREDRPLMFDQQTQTLIDTQTFVDILNINKKSNSIMRQSMQKLGTIGEFNNKKGRDQFDFSQHVDPSKILHEYELIALANANKRILYASNAKDAYASQESICISLQKHRQDGAKTVSDFLNPREAFRQRANKPYSLITENSEIKTRYIDTSHQSQRKTINQNPKKISSEEMKQIELEIVKLELEREQLSDNDLMVQYGKDYQMLLDQMNEQKKSPPDEAMSGQGGSFDMVYLEPKSAELKQSERGMVIVQQQQDQKINEDIKYGPTLLDQEKVSLVEKGTSPQQLSPISFIKQRNEQIKMPMSKLKPQGNMMYPVNHDSLAILQNRGLIDEEMQLALQISQVDKQMFINEFQHQPNENVFNTIDYKAQKLKSTQTKNEGYQQKVQIRKTSKNGKAAGRNNDLSLSPSRISNNAGGQPGLNKRNAAQVNAKAQIQPRYDKSTRRDDQQEEIWALKETNLKYLDSVQVLVIAKPK